MNEEKYDMKVYLQQSMADLRQCQMIFLENGDISYFDYVLNRIENSEILNEKDLLNGLELDKKKRGGELKVATIKLRETLETGLKSKNDDELRDCLVNALNDYNKAYVDTERNYANEVIRSISTYYGSKQ